MAFAPIVVAILIGLLFGRVRSGRLAAVARTKLRLRILFVVALACGLAVDFVELPNPGIWAIVGLTAGLLFAIRNVHVVGMMVIAIGIAANLLPVAINGATPVRAGALVQAGMVDAADLDRVTLHGARELAEDGTVAAFMGDTIPLSIADQVMSFGDLVVLVGMASVIANLMLQRRPRSVPPSALRSLEAFGWKESSVSTGSIIELSTDLRPVPPPKKERQLVGASSSSSASPVHD